MRKVVAAITICLLPLTAICQQTLETVTTGSDNNSTQNMIRVTGSNNVPTTGSGIELYFNNATGTGYLNAVDRVSGTYKRLILSGLPVSMGSRVLVNGSTDDGATALQVQGGGLFTGKITVSGQDFRALSTDNLIDTRLGSNAFVNGVGGTGTVTSYPFIIATNATERLRITADGNVVIGATDPKGYKLAVAGKVIAESIKVKLSGNWPDYVFTSDYKLPSLQELEAYIKANQHLPGIPSAEEVAADGLVLEEMNKKLLQKVEELTLYLLEEHKRNEAQQKEIAELKARLNKVEKE